MLQVYCNLIDNIYYHYYNEDKIGEESWNNTLLVISLRYHRFYNQAVIYNIQREVFSGDNLSFYLCVFIGMTFVVFEYFNFIKNVEEQVTTY